MLRFRIIYWNNTGYKRSPDLISRVTDKLLTNVAPWQQCLLEAKYLIAPFDALRLKIRDAGTLKSKTAYLALCSHADGRKEIRGVWIK